MLVSAADRFLISSLNWEMSAASILYCSSTGINGLSSSILSLSSCRKDSERNEKQIGISISGWWWLCCVVRGWEPKFRRMWDHAWTRRWCLGWLDHIHWTTWTLIIQSCRIPESFWSWWISCHPLSVWNWSSGLSSGSPSSWHIESPFEFASSAPQWTETCSAPRTQQAIVNSHLKQKCMFDSCFLHCLCLCVSAWMCSWQLLHENKHGKVCQQYTSTKIQMTKQIYQHFYLYRGVCFCVCIALVLQLSGRHPALYMPTFSSIWRSCLLLASLEHRLCSGATTVQIHRPSASWAELYTCQPSFGPIVWKYKQMAHMSYG